MHTNTQAHIEGGDEDSLNQQDHEKHVLNDGY